VQRIERDRGVEQERHVRTQRDFGFDGFGAGLVDFAASAAG
jgi:hypothetical protein